MLPLSLCLVQSVTDIKSQFNLSTKFQKLGPCSSPDSTTLWPQTITCVLDTLSIMLACIQSQPQLCTAPRSVQAPPEAVAFGIRKNGLIMSVNIVMQRVGSSVCKFLGYTKLTGF